MKDVTLIDTQVQCIPTNMTGPLGHGLSALLLGRSSATRKGIFILPKIIDADFASIISIMVQTLSPPVHIPKGSKIGQLVPFKANVPKVSLKECAEGSFDSTDNAEFCLALDIGKAKPMEKVTLLDKSGRSQTFEILVDTGADVTIISKKDWPVWWSLKSPQIPVMGVGGMQNTQVSKHHLQMQLSDGSLCSVRPYVMSIPVSLLGRDVLGQLGATLVTKQQHF